MWSGSLSHNGLTGCGNDGGDFASHLLEHEIGGMFDVAHGAGLAAIWGSWARYVIDNCTPRFAKFAVNVMGVEPGKDDMETGFKGHRGHGRLLPCHQYADKLKGTRHRSDRRTA